MVNNIEALIISAGEPQLERCLKAARNQTAPFSNIVHVDNVVPESSAFNRGMSLGTSEWVMKIDGDMILVDNAVEKILGSMIDESNVFMFSYVLEDTFLRSLIYGCGVFRRKLFTKVPYPNMLTDDAYAAKKIQKMGYERRRPLGDRFPVATHFDDPDDFQVFRRFYSRGVKGGRDYLWVMVHKLHAKTGDPRYQLAMDAIDFGWEKKHYPSSHNIIFDRKMFEEFNESRRRNS